jgi:signal transduction histidine kinase
MQPGQSPDAIDTRLVFRVYSWIAIVGGYLVVDSPPRMFPALLEVTSLPGVPWGKVALFRTAAALIVAAGITAAGLGRIDDPVSRRRALYWFASAHLFFGMIFLIQWHAVFSVVAPRPVLGWTPLVIGIVLLYLAATCAHAPRLSRPFRGLFDNTPGPVLMPGPVLVERARPGMDTLRSQYEQQIRQAARLEERARLARDLHDAVKQQLFSIQTSAATVQARYASDADGALAALEQIRTSARDAMTEMEALIGQLQAPPMENAGLVTSLHEQCEALELRTGATVTFEPGTLPPSEALHPGTQQALFRAAQEALSNIARHARATHVNVRLGLIRDRLELTIRDDGTGFDPMNTSPGMGTNNMKARICEVSGVFLLHSKPRQGTTVAFSVPCDTSTSREFLKKAFVSGLVCALMIVSSIYGDAWEQPWNAIVATIAAITVARYMTAWYRVRDRVELMA